MTNAFLNYPSISVLDFPVHYLTQDEKIVIATHNPQILMAHRPQFQFPLYIIPTKRLVQKSVFINNKFDL